MSQALKGSFLTVKSELGIEALSGKVAVADGTYALRDQGEAYNRNFAGESDTLMPVNYPWEKNAESTGTIRVRCSFHRGNDSLILHPIIGVRVGFRERHHHVDSVRVHIGDQLVR